MYPPRTGSISSCNSVSEGTTDTVGRLATLFDRINETGASTVVSLSHHARIKYAQRTPSPSSSLIFTSGTLTGKHVIFDVLPLFEITFDLH